MHPSIEMNHQSCCYTVQRKQESNSNIDVIEVEVDVMAEEVTAEKVIGEEEEEEGCNRDSKNNIDIDNNIPSSTISGSSNSDCVNKSSSNTTNAATTSTTGSTDTETPTSGATASAFSSTGAETPTSGVTASTSGSTDAKTSTSAATVSVTTDCDNDVVEVGARVREAVDDKDEQKMKKDLNSEHIDIRRHQILKYTCQKQVLKYLEGKYGLLLKSNTAMESLVFGMDRIFPPSVLSLTAKDRDECADESKAQDEQATVMAKILSWINDMDGIFESYALFLKEFFFLRTIIDRMNLPDDTFLGKDIVVNSTEGWDEYDRLSNLQKRLLQLDEIFHQDQRLSNLQKRLLELDEIFQQDQTFLYTALRNENENPTTTTATTATTISGNAAATENEDKGATGIAPTDISVDASASAVNHHNGDTDEKVDDEVDEEQMDKEVEVMVEEKEVEGMDEVDKEEEVNRSDLVVGNNCNIDEGIIDDDEDDGEEKDDGDDNDDDEDDNSYRKYESMDIDDDGDDSYDEDYNARDSDDNDEDNDIDDDDGDEMRKRKDILVRTRRILFQTRRIEKLYSDITALKKKSCSLRDEMETLLVIFYGQMSLVTKDLLTYQYHGQMSLVTKDLLTYR